MQQNIAQSLNSDFIHHQFQDLVAMVNKPTTTPNQLVQSIEALEKLMLAHVKNSSASLDTIPMMTPLEQDLLQSLQEIENGEIEFIDENYIANLTKNLHHYSVDLGDKITHEAMTIYE